jgi:pimeloyl-ACP methyl ester carboxylesterase
VIRVDFSHFSILFLLLLGALPNSALACEVALRLPKCEGANCAEQAKEAFARYAGSYQTCGISKKGLPYLLTANPKAEFRGTIVLVHGLAASPRHLSDVATEYQKNGYNVVLPLLYGHGGKDEFFDEARLTKWLKDVSFASDIAARLGGPIFIGGLSTGATVAALQATEEPGRFSGFVGFDPAFAVNPKAKKKLLAACAAKHVYDYSSEIGCKDERDEDLIRQIAAMEIEELVAEVCGESSIEIPAFNPEISLAGACALGAAVRRLERKERIKDMPPSFFALSSDTTGVFEHLSREGIAATAQKIPLQEFIVTKDPSHKVMLAKCSPGFRRSVRGSLEFLKENAP